MLDVQLNYEHWVISIQDVVLSNEVTTEDTEDLYDNTANDIMLIYRDITGDINYNSDNIYNVNDYATISDQTIYVGDGQTLDMTKLDRNASGVTIIIGGTAKIISNPNITLEKSRIIIANTDENDEIVFENLNLVGGGYDKAALEIRSKCTIKIQGNVSFTGSSDMNNLYLAYSTDRPIYASQGVLTCDEVTLDGDGSLNVIGKNGGAGLCIDRETVTIKNITVVATGSVKYDKYLTLGAGIGVCASFPVAGKSLIQPAPGILEGPYNKVYGTVQGVYAGELELYNATVTAQGSEYYPDAIAYAEDIGGIYYYEERDTSSLKQLINGGGLFKDSKVTLKNMRICSQITSRGLDNRFYPDLIKVTAYTNGKEYTNKHGLELNIIGKNNEQSGWVKTDIGTENGEYVYEFNANSVGEITEIQLRNDIDNGSSDRWFGEKVVVETVYTGNTITVYGGRWIKNKDVVTLKPTDNIYQLTINTGNDKNAGTDANISVYLQDGSGHKSENINLSDIHHESDAFEKNDRATFLIYVPDDFEECTNVLISSDNTGAKAGWLMSSFSVSKFQGDKEDNGFTFTASQWFVEKRTLNFGKKSGSTGVFDLVIKTSDKNKAGTDSNIYLVISGTNGSTEEIELDPYTEGDNFERGDKDCFSIGNCVISIGSINKITIRKDDVGDGPDWHLEYITITEKVSDGQTAESVTFDVNDWIEEGSYTFKLNNDKNSSKKQNSAINRELLKQLKQNDDNSYSLDVSNNIVMNSDAFDLIAEKKVLFTLNMLNDEGKILYSVTFDGNKFTKQGELIFKSGYSFANGYAVIDFLSESELPAGTVLRINSELFKFKDNDSICILKKSADGEWEDEIEVIAQNGILVLDIDEGKRLLIKNHNASLPSNIEVENNNFEWLWIIISIVVIAGAVFTVIIMYRKRKTI